MAIKLTSKDAISESLRPVLEKYLQEREDGLYYDPSPLISTVENVKNEKAQLKVRLDEALSRITKLEADSAEALDKLAGSAGVNEQVKVAYEKKFQETQAAMEAERSKYSAKLTQIALDNALNEIAADFINPDIIKPYLGKHIKAEFKDDTVNLTVFDGEGNLTAQTPKEFAAKLAQEESFKPFLKGSLASGSGAAGQNGSANKKLSEMSESEQVHLYQTNPARYNQLVQQKRME